MTKGQKVYESNCVACHGKKGEGPRNHVSAALPLRLHHEKTAGAAAQHGQRHQRYNQSQRQNLQRIHARNRHQRCGHCRRRHLYHERL
ncbi:c-type cytochrome [Neisseria meningitidis]